MLNDIEARITNEDFEEDSSFELYISNIKIGVSCIYYESPADSYINYSLPFARTSIQENTNAYGKVYQWINSIKKISTLISGSGAINRRIFFDEQHMCVLKSSS